MKNIFTYSGILAVLTIGLISCNSSKWAATNYTDDLYYSKNDNPPSVSDEFIPLYSDKTLKKEDRKASNSGESEYLSQNPNYALEQVTGDLSEIQKTYSDILTNDSISNADSVLYYNNETGYWVDGFEGSAMDLDYATRLIKFHGPFIGIPYWSPLYTDVVYANPWDWNVYVDNNYVYAFPTYSNPVYWNSGFYTGMGYGRFGMGMSFGMGYGMGFGYGWGWGYPYYPYYPYPYYPYMPGYGYGYCPPYYGPGYGPIYGSGHPSDDYYYGPRYATPATGLMSADSPGTVNNPRVNGANYPNNSDLKSTVTTTRATPNNNLEIKRGNTTYTRISRNNHVQSDETKKSTAKSGITTSRGQSGNVRTTRRSYSSYSPIKSTKRPTFNRTTYSRTSTSGRRITTGKPSPNRVYSAPSRSSSPRSSNARSSRVSKPISTSKSLYKTGSSRSSTYSTSKYSGSSSTRSRSSYTRSSSGTSGSSSSRFSGSSYSGTSRSSGSSSRTTRSPRR